MLSENFSSFGGADIVVVMGGRWIIETQAVSVDVRREKVPLYIMGDPNFRALSRRQDCA